MNKPKTKKSVANNRAAKPSGTHMHDILNERVLNELTTLRTALWDRMLDRATNDIDKECGYPPHVTAELCKTMYEREGVGTRVVSVLPEESWANDPTVYETDDDTEETAFEKQWSELEEKHSLFHYLHRVDEMSGIGHYGVILLGLDDGQDLDKPVLSNTDERGAADGSGGPTKEHKLLYVRVFDETLAPIAEFEKDVKSPRYGQPLFYNLKFISDSSLAGTTTAQQLDHTEKKVHWSRIVHFADNRKSSEVFGTPRMQPVFNRLIDLRKVLGGSGQMFWNGAFPGLALEVDPDVETNQIPEINDQDLDEEMTEYSMGLKRWILLQGIKAKSLAPQITDPTNTVMILIKIISLVLGIPVRLLLGTEAAHLASSQDGKHWNRRLARRQEKYVTPMVIRPFIERLIALGCLEQPAQMHVSWPDLNEQTDAERAETAAKRTDAMAKYIGGNVQQIYPPEHYMVIELGMPVEQVDAILKDAANEVAVTENDPDLDDDDDDLDQE